MKNVRVLFLLLSLFFPVALPGQWSQLGQIPYGGIDRILYFNGALFILHKGIVEKSTDFGYSWQFAFDIGEMGEDVARSWSKCHLELTVDGPVLIVSIPYHQGLYFLSQDGIKWERMPDSFLPVRDVRPTAIPCTVQLSGVDSVAGTIMDYAEARDSMFAIALVKRGEKDFSYEVIGREKNLTSKDEFSGIWTCLLPDSTSRSFSTIIPFAITIPGDNIPALFYDKTADLLVVYGNEQTILVNSSAGWRSIPDLDISVELHPPLLADGMLLAVAEDGGIWRL